MPARPHTSAMPGRTMPMTGFCRSRQSLSARRKTARPAEVRPTRAMTAYQIASLASRFAGAGVSTGTASGNGVA